MSPPSPNQTIALPAEIRILIYQFLAVQQSEATPGVASLAPFFQVRHGNLYHIRMDAQRLRLARPARIQLRLLEVPPFALASRATLHEFLPDYFSAGRFTITVGPWGNPTRLPDPENRSDEIVSDLLVAQREAVDPTDPIFLTRRTAGLLEKCSEAAVFRNVRFCLHASREGRQILADRSFQVAALMLVWQDRRLDVETSGRDAGQREREVAIVGLAVELARELTRREGFKGFTVRDLRNVAIVLRSGDGVAAAAAAAES